jgi:threonylcarbamoyladenosine tRNA methylthiotransferase MtaB
MIDQTVFENKKVAFYTLGCKLNFSETSGVSRSMLNEGFQKVNFAEKADVYVINTCSVTELADKKAKQIIKKAAKTNPSAFIVVTGCFAQLKPEDVSHIEGVDLVLGSNEKFDILQHLGNLDKRNTPDIVSGNILKSKEFKPTFSAGDRTRSFLKIQDGCDYFCSYCTIPMARGLSRSDTIQNTIQQAQMAIKTGAKEIILTGVNIGDFGKNHNESFYELIQALDKLDGVDRFRISSIEPNLLSHEMIEFVANSKKFMPHFHLPLQSGSDTVLKLMKRKYDTQLFKDRVNTIRSILPHAFIGVDVIVGLRGETKALFQETVKFLENLDFSQLHVFTYSERPNTQALKIDGEVPIHERKERSKSLHELSDKKTRAFYKQHLGTEALVLFEKEKHDGYLNGFTENYIRIEAPYDTTLFNQIKRIRLNSLSLTGDAVSCSIIS